MFKIVQSPTYTWPVTFNIPVDGGRAEKQTFDGMFKRISQSRIEELRLQIERGEITDSNLAREVLVGWKGVLDDSGEEMPFSEGARDMLLDVPLVASAVVVSFLESLSGARRKN